MHKPNRFYRVGAARAELARGLPLDAASHAADPVAFARDVLKIDPDEPQQLALLVKDKNIILNCCRQWGKSTTAAIKAVHHGLFHPESTIVVVSRTLRQSGELMLKIERFLETAKLPTTGDGINPGSLVLPNKTRILAVPGEEANIRGISAVDLLVIDEAARVKESLYAGARPMLATRDGKIMLMSTPYAKSGFFFDEWRDGDPEEWFKLAIPATECPRIPHLFLERERNRLGARYFKQEYLCQFLDSEYQLFPRELIEAALDDNLKPLPGFEEEDVELPPPDPNKRKRPPDLWREDVQSPKGTPFFVTKDKE